MPPDIRDVAARSQIPGAPDTRPAVLFLIHDLRSGGAERAFLEYVRRVRAVRPVAVLVRPHGRLISELPRGLPVYHLEAGGDDGPFSARTLPIIPGRIRDRHEPVRGCVALIAKARRLRDIARREGAVLVSTFLHKSHVIALTAKAFPGPALGVAINVHEQPGQHIDTHFRGMAVPLMHLFYRWGLPRADAVIAVAGAVRAEIEERAGWPVTSISVVENPVDVGALRARAKAGPRPSDLPSGDAPLVMGLGRVEKIKGFDLLVEAAAIVRRTRSVRVALVGEGSEREALRGRIASLGLDDAVVLTGHRSNPLPYLAVADLLVIPSRTDAWPTVATEAMGLGTPVLATRCSPGLVDLLGDGRFGALVECESPAALAEGILELLAHPERATELAERAGERLGDLSPSSVVPRYEQVLLGAAGRSRVRRAGHG